MRTISFFQARDEAHRVFLAGSDMPAPTRAIFLYLLSCTFFTGEVYGWVRHSSCGIATIAKVTGYSEHAVKNHLRLLESNDLIRRHARARGHRGRANDEIRIEWAYLYQGAPDERCSRELLNADQGAPGELSSSYIRKELQEPQGVVVDMTQRRRASV